MRLSFQHHSTQASVQSKIEEAVIKALELGNGQINQFECAWVNNKFEFSFTILSKTIKGTTDITDEEIIIDAGIPLMFRPFEEEVRTRILGTLNEMFP